jgi:hypothetical protein
VTSSCRFCFRKFRGEGDYCQAHVERAQTPAGVLDTKFAKSYTAK